jgi:hypothetical protein
MKDKGVQRLAAILALLKAMSSAERAAALCYLFDRCARRIR